MTTTAFLLAMGAVARLTRLVTADVLAAPLRDRLACRDAPDSGLCYLLTCPWCASMWVAPPVVLAAWAAHGAAWFTLPAAMLTISYLYGLAATRLDADED